MKYDHILQPLLVLVVGVIIGAMATFFCTAGERKAVVQRKQFKWVLFLQALEKVEAPKTESQAAAAIKREGAYGPLQIRQPALTDVNRKYGTKVNLVDVENSLVMARWTCVHYIRMYEADTSYEKAARVWNGGPTGHKKVETLPHWLKVKAAMIELQMQEKK
jgi:hypothetical protein